MLFSSFYVWKMIQYFWLCPKTICIRACYNSTVIGTFKQHKIVWLALKLVFHLYQKANLDFGFIIPLHAIRLICVWLRTGPDWSPCGSQIHPIDVSPLSFSQCRTKCHILIYFFVWINGNWNLNLQQDLPWLITGTH